MQAPVAVADSPKEALAQFITKLHQDYYPWYDRSVRRHYLLWLPLQIVTVASGFAAALVAALMTDEAFQNFGIGRVLLVVLPALSSAASLLIAQIRLQDRYRLREKGRLAIQDLNIEADRRFAAATRDEEYSQIHMELQKKLREIERYQGQEYFSLSGLKGEYSSR